MRKITDLKAGEFPGVDPVKFAEWQTLQEKGNKAMIGLAIGFSAVALLLLLVDIGGAAGNFAVAFIIILAPIIAMSIAMGPANRLAAEIGLDKEAIRAALKREDQD